MEICTGQHPFGLSRRPYIRIRFARLSWIQEQIHGPMSAAKMGCNKTLKSAPCSISIVLIKKLFSQLVLCHMLIAAQRSRARMAAPLFFCTQPTTTTLISFGSVARDLHRARMYSDRPRERERGGGKMLARPTLISNLSLVFIKNLIIQFENSSFVFSPFKLIKSQTILGRKKPIQVFHGKTKGKKSHRPESVRKTKKFFSNGTKWNFCLLNQNHSI